MPKQSPWFYMPRTFFIVKFLNLNKRIDSQCSIGYEVVKCESGMDCLNYLKEEKTDLILLDIEMPIMNGIQVLKEIRGNDDIADTPVMFLTASADADTVEDARKLGVVDYINKPFLPDELKSRVEKVFF